MFDSAMVGGDMPQTQVGKLLEWWNGDKMNNFTALYILYCFPFGTKVDESNLGLHLRLFSL